MNKAMRKNLVKMVKAFFKSLGMDLDINGESGISFIYITANEDDPVQFLIYYDEDEGVELTKKDFDKDIFNPEYVKERMGLDEALSEIATYYMPLAIQSKLDAVNDAERDMKELERKRLNDEKYDLLPYEGERLEEMLKELRTHQQITDSQIRVIIRERATHLRRISRADYDKNPEERLAKFYQVAFSVTFDHGNLFLTSTVSDKTMGGIYRDFKFLKIGKRGAVKDLSK